MDNYLHNNTHFLRIAILRWLFPFYKQPLLSIFSIKEVKRKARFSVFIMGNQQIIMRKYATVSEMKIVG